MAADLFESYAVTLVAALILGSQAFGDKGLVFPLLIPAIGALTAVAGVYLTRPKAGENGLTTINRSFYLSSGIAALASVVLAYVYLPGSFGEFTNIADSLAGADGDPRFIAASAVVIGIVMSAGILGLTGYYTRTDYRPVKDVGKTSLTGAATVILAGLSVGFESAVYTTLVIGAAVFGAVLGPVFGGLAEFAGIRLSFTIVGLLTLVFAGVATLARSAPVQQATLAGLRRALRDERFLGGLWLNMLPAMMFGLLIVLTPLALDDAGWTTFAIAGVFFASGLVEVVLNPYLGRVSDRVGRLLPIRVALTASVIAAVALAAVPGPVLLALLICAAAISFGSLYTPGMALTSHRAEAAGLAQGLAFGVMNTAWAFGELVGPTAGGVLADSYGDATPYLIGAGLCAVTLATTYRIAGRVRTRAA